MLYNPKNDKKLTDSVGNPTVLSNIFRKEQDYGDNEVAQQFDRLFNVKSTEQEIRRIENTVGQGAAAVAYPNGMSPHGSFSNIIGHDPHFADPALIRKQIAERLLLDYWKKNREKAMKYERMLRRPEIADAMNIIVNEAIYPSDTGVIASLRVSEDLEVGDITKSHLQKIYRTDVTRKLFKMHKYGRHHMRDLLTYGRIFFEVNYDPVTNEIVGLQKLPQHNMLVIIYEGEIIGYRQMLEGSYAADIRRNSGRNYIDYSPNQILYASLGINGPGLDNDPFGILEDAVKHYNQLNAIEDAVTMYRIAWGSEKLVFKVDVTNMPKKFAEAHIREQKHELSRRLDYNTATGEIASSGRIIGLSEHFFIPVTASGGSSIERLQAGDNISKVDDINYFKRLLINALKVPPGLVTALAGDGMNFSHGKMSEITQEQVKFYRMVMDYQQPLGEIMTRLFTMIIALDPSINDDIVDQDFFDTEFSRDNYFQFYLDAEVNTTRFAALQESKDYIGTLFSRKFILKRIFKMTDEEEALNAEWLEEEKRRGEHEETEEK